MADDDDADLGVRLSGALVEVIDATRGRTPEERRAAAPRRETRVEREIRLIGEALVAAGVDGDIWQWEPRPGGGMRALLVSGGLGLLHVEWGRHGPVVVAGQCPNGCSPKRDDGSLLGKHGNTDETLGRLSAFAIVCPDCGERRTLFS